MAQYVLTGYWHCLSRLAVLDAQRIIDIGALF